MAPLPPVPSTQESAAKDQSVLVEFLTTDLELALTILEMARMVKDADHRVRILGNIHRAVLSIRHFQSHIADVQFKKHIQERVDWLETEAETLHNN